MAWENEQPSATTGPPSISSLGIDASLVHASNNAEVSAINGVCQPQPPPPPCGFPPSRFFDYIVLGSDSNLLQSSFSDPVPGTFLNHEKVPPFVLAFARQTLAPGNYCVPYNFHGQLATLYVLVYRRSYLRRNLSILMPHVTLLVRHITTAFFMTTEAVGDDQYHRHIQRLQEKARAMAEDIFSTRILFDDAHDGLAV
ncbi:hypothetical protein SPI_00162 [Niveomyces insectorum RCEF 264]|uniref:Uncharacterized protein n=1 Tax=Niveomyces insectorum RCEF 264 TaxID=1081102 RepID=A0A167ZW65_9HYPO|nr:hypothetical protein SPI_00162 [Niveomyces insectorum RCEF 264]